MPPEQARTPAGKVTTATFTIKWTNPTASAALRRRDTISPSAQSISVTINGKLTAVANRNGNPTQAIALDAPVGTDAFAFDVYDQTNAAGHLLGTATVTQQIVDGAANNVSASIAATCAATNVSYANDDLLSIPTFVASVSNFSQILRSIILTGQSPATLVVEPQDADGNVIVTANGGIVTGSITGSATATPIDGAHLQLTPATGRRTTTSDTLTVSAPGCPSTTVGVLHSPAIYAQTMNGNNTVMILDWYGDVVLTTVMSGGSDVLIGYDTHLKKMVAYNKTSGQVTEYSPDLKTSTPLYSIPANVLATWSNYSNGVLGVTAPVTSMGNSLQYFVVQAGHQTNFPSLGVSCPVHVLAASTFSNDQYAFSGDCADIYQLNLATLGTPTRVTPVPSTPSALAVDASSKYLIDFNYPGEGFFVNEYSYPSLFNHGGYNFGFLDYANASASANNIPGTVTYEIAGAVDTDNPDYYELDESGYLEAVTYFQSFLFDSYAGADTVLVVVSANEN